MLFLAFKSVAQEEWFWAIIAIMVTLLVFIAEQRAGNRISQSSFIYNISNDFANNERIGTVYQWLEKCRRTNRGISNYRDLTFSAQLSESRAEGEELPVSFICIDTYVNHFESVYIILGSVGIHNIDQLFQQRFLCFMLNPYIQKEELYACFEPDENDFKLLKLWLRSISRRMKYSNREMIRFLNTFTCGNFEFREDRMPKSRGLNRITDYFKVRQYLLNYVSYICDPHCRYGFYEFTSRSDRKVLRLIRSDPSDAEQILALQDKAHANMADPNMFFPSTEGEIRTALANPDQYLCLQVVDGDQIVAFCQLTIDPPKEQDLRLDLGQHGISCPGGTHGILETVFVDPDYRGFGMQQILVETLCQWARIRKVKTVYATVHPDNIYSHNNLTAAGFQLLTPTPLPKYGDVRNFYALSTAKPENHTDKYYTVYPYA
jgi:GNAT superfamily N-acetyltransferase